MDAMTRKKFEKGMRIQVTHEHAPARFKGRIGTVRGKYPYEGYAVEFDDNPGTVENVGSNFMEVLTLDQAKRSYVESAPRDVENRRSPRYGADCVVAIEFQGHRVIGKCIDYNENGFGAIVEHVLPLGWIMNIEFPLKDRKPVRIQARPIYEKDLRYGFEFLFPDNNKRALVADFFAEHFQSDS